MSSVYLIAAVAATAGLLFGFDTGVISGAILFINKDFQLNHVQTEIIVSAVLFGAFFSAMTSGKLCDLIGRKKVIIITALIFILGTLVCGLTPNANGLIAGRIILGFAIGIASFAAPLYLAEIAPQQSRGFIVTLNQLAITLGILFSYIVDYGFSHIQAWRLMLLVGVVPAIGLLCGMLFLPESPRFLILNNQVKKAQEIFKRIRAAHQVNDEINAIIESQKQQKLQGRDLFGNKRLIAVLLVGITLAVLQQVTGINTIIYYAPTIFKLAGFKTTNAILVTSLIGVVNVVFTLIAMPLIDKVGRKTLLMIGVSGMCMSLCAIAYAFNQQELSNHLRILTLFSMMVYIACFAMSLGPMVFIILSELFPLSIRGQGMSIAMSANWGANMIVALTFLSFIHRLGVANTFYLYAVLSIATLMFVYLFIPETKGVSLEQIEQNILAGLSCKQLGRRSELNAIE